VTILSTSEREQALVESNTQKELKSTNSAQAKNDQERSNQSRKQNEQTTRHFHQSFMIFIIIPPLSVFSLPMTRRGMMSQVKLIFADNSA